MLPLDDNTSILYVENLEFDADIETAFDTWLRDHIADVLQFPGFLSAEILEDDAAASGRLRRIVQYRLRNQGVLDGFLDGHAPQLFATGVAKFGVRFSAERRRLGHREEFVHGAISTANCLNCGEVLTGQHCSHCGQRARVRVLSLWGLLRDVIGDTLDWDSRLWRTLRPLAFKPGWLTLEFLRGRRASYTPPFRMYLILSVLFFLVASLGADPSGIHLDFDDDHAKPALDRDGTAVAKTVVPPKAVTSPESTLSPERQTIIDTVITRVPEADRERVRNELETKLAKLGSAPMGNGKPVADERCKPTNLQFDIGPLGKRYAPRMLEACRKIVADSQGFGRALFQNIPKMMFIFLPLIAALMFVFYLGSGRYYVEHLLFFVYFHAFFFLCGLVIVGLDRASTALQGSAVGAGVSAAGDAAAVMIAVYVPYYLYRAMRRVYGQGRVVTLVKYALLSVGYLVFMTLTAVGLLAYTALTL